MSAKEARPFFAQARHIVHWVYSTYGAWPAESLEQRLQHCVFQGLADMDNVFRTCGRRVGDRLGHAQIAGQMFLEAYAGLAAEAIRRKATTWKLVPKLHQVQHMLYQHAPQANPRSVHCYCEEDLVRACASPTAQARVL